MTDRQLLHWIIHNVLNESQLDMVPPGGDDVLRNYALPRPPEPAVSAEARDAARYRWLKTRAHVHDTRDGPITHTYRIDVAKVEWQKFDYKDLDAAVDAAMGTPPADNKENGK